MTPELHSRLLAYAAFRGRVEIFVRFGDSATDALRLAGIEDALKKLEAELGEDGEPQS